MQELHTNTSSFRQRRRLLNTLSGLTLGLITAKTATASPPKKNLPSYKQLPTFTDLLLEKNLQDGMVVETLGYHKVGDLGNARYRILNSSSAQEYPFAIVLPTKQLALLLHEGFVNYAMFGAFSNGKDDDGVVILKAHEFANAYNLPVFNPSGEYWIQSTRNIPIKTSTNWGNSIFHLNEQFNTPKQTNFEVLSQYEPITIQLSELEKKQLLSELKPGARYVPFLDRYKNHMLCLVDDKDRIGVRYGKEYKGSTWAKEDFFYVEEGGVIIGDISWEFSDITKLTAYPANQSYLTVEGGTFLVSGDNPGIQGGPYHQGGITVRRSRTIIRNQWVGLEKDKQDISLTPRGGFYTFSYVYDVLLENVRLIPWEQKRAEENRIVRAGTYGIGGNRILNATFRNVTAEGNMVHWGVFGTNLNKNFVIENCQLNRVDVHFHCWNITIRNSKIGQRGITLTGGGKLFMENTTVYHNRFIDMRQDYGGKWDGPIHIQNCTLIPQTNAESTILTLVPADFDYKYPIVLGHQINIENFCFDYSMATDNIATAWSIRFPGYSESSLGQRVIFPNIIRLENISTKFRKKGIRLFTLPDTTGFQVISGDGGYTMDGVRPNATFHFVSIQLEDTANDPSFHHFSIATKQGSNYHDGSALYPKIQIQHSSPLSASLGSCAAEIIIEHSIISQLSAGTEQEAFQGDLYFQHCTFAPVRDPKLNTYFPIHSNHSVTFTDCLLQAPQEEDKLYFEELDHFSFISINKKLRFNHTNTRLGKSILQNLKEKKINLTPKFIALLKSHHELESEDV